jgi:hypothetical protein
MTTMRAFTARHHLAGVLLVAFLGGSLLVLSSPVQGQDKEKPQEKAKAPDKDKAPEKEKGQDKPKPSESPNALSDAEVVNFINEQLEKNWTENGIKPSPPATEYAWLRRIHLDLMGRIPHYDEVNAFFKRPKETRKAQTVKALIAHPDYAKNWANLWTVWLLTRNNIPGTDRENLRHWLEDGFAMGKKYDKMVVDLMTANGKANETSGTAPATNFILSHMGERVEQGKRGQEGQFEMVPVTSRATKLFLGIQTQCTQCHDHPFIDDRKQNQYWGVNAFFRQAERRPELIQTRGNRQVESYYELKENPSTNRDGGIYFEKRNGLLLKTTPTYLDGTKVGMTTGSRRDILAKMMVEDEFFAKAIVNRMWAHFHGRGFTNPIDDFGEHNPVSNPELLDYLAKAFVQSGYDLQRLQTWICSAKSYQLSSVANSTNAKADAEPYFSRMLLKAMTPEQLVDSIFIATSADQTRSSPQERRRMYDEWLRDFSVNFGDDEGNEATFNGTVIQALLLMNGGRLNEVIKLKPGSLLAKAMTIPNARSRLNYLFMSVLSRNPTDREASVALNMLRSQAKEPWVPWQDILWALLNSNEFFLNH